MSAQPSFVVNVVTITLSLVLGSVVGAMIYGLFDTRVDNKEIFTIIGPAFQMIVGVFVGILGGRGLGGKVEG